MKLRGEFKSVLNSYLITVLNKLFWAAMVQNNFKISKN